MRSKAPLALMEQLAMILVFAVAAALCLQAFALSNRMSQANEARDRAMLEAQNTAEVLKSCQGSYEAASVILDGQWEEDRWLRLFDENWQSVQAEAAYSLCVTLCESGTPLLGRAEITVLSVEGKCLVRLPVAWQEGGSHA